MKNLMSLKLLSLIVLILSVVAGCSKPPGQSPASMASTRGNAQPSASGKRKKADYNPNTTKKFRPKTKKQLRKEAKMAEKPKYNNPLYFGHKKMPKKRLPGKRKYCKECGMVH